MRYWRLGIQQKKFSMDFPKIQNGQYAVLKVNMEPGTVLGLGPHLDLDRGRWNIFDSFSAARDYARAQAAKQPFVECGIYNASEQQVQAVRG